MEFRPATADDVDAILRLNQQGFNASPADAERARQRMTLGHWRVLDDHGVRATMRMFPLAHFYGGRAVAAHGVASVAVSPAERGRGLGRVIMTEALREMRATGVPTSSLYPATIPLYRETGYGFGMIRTAWKARLDALPDDRVDGATIEALRQLDDIARLYDEIARTQNGLVARTTEWWEQNVIAGRDGTVRWAYVVREGDAVTGWIIYETQSRSDSWRFRLACRDLFWSTPSAGRALLSMAALHRSTAEELTWTGAPDEPLQWLTKDHAIEPDGSYHAMVRLVDVPGAIEARGYPARADVSFTIAVDDRLFAENAGPWRIDVADGSAKVSPSEDARARCDVPTLASMWASLLTPRDAVRLGMLHTDDETIAAMEIAFAGPTPWIADFY